MGVGDVTTVETCTDLHYVDTGMYDTAGYGAVYIVDADRPAVVDTGIGTNVDRVLAALDTVGIAPTDLAAIAVTHVHLDHAGGAGFLADACPNATVYVHEIGAPHLADPTRLVEGTRRAVGDQWQYYTEPEPVPEDRIVALTDGDTVDLGDRRLAAHHVPGHAPHQVAYHDSLDDAVFTADAAGIWVPALGRVVETSPPPNFEFEQCLEDVDTIRGLDPDHLLYPHFGPAPRTALEDYPDVLRKWVDEVAAALDTHGDPETTLDAIDVDPGRERVWGAFKARAETRMNAEGVIHYLQHRD
ncbi:MAG: MBL fold metallo-hydrolase [Halobacteriaceae archaeon]